MKADAQSLARAEKEALQWAVDNFRDCDLKSRGNSALLDFTVAEDVWRNDPRKLNAYIALRVVSAGGYTRRRAGELKRRGESGWDTASSIRGLCMYAALLMDRGDPLPESLRNFIIGFLFDPNLKGIGPPGPKHGDRKFRDLQIAGAIEHIVETWKFQATRNEATERASAASIVREALEKVHVHMVEKAVNKIWAEQRRFFGPGQPGPVDFRHWLRGRRTRN